LAVTGPVTCCIRSANRRRAAACSSLSPGGCSSRITDEMKSNTDAGNVGFRRFAIRTAVATQR
jgi:hypothetical protein